MKGRGEWGWGMGEVEWDGMGCDGMGIGGRILVSLEMGLYTSMGGYSVGY